MFRFKQFIIHQDKCAMKVCTDSCILGAWANVHPEEKVLDIGAGTGLLSLMLAQRAQASFYAVEIDRDTASQAAENFHESPFSSYISVFHTDIKDFPETGFDLIISNPPFFENQLQNPNQEKKAVRHTIHLSFEKLASVIQEKLLPDGRAVILLPPDSMRKFESTMFQQDLFPAQRLLIRHTAETKVIREITEFRKIKGVINETELAIYKPDGLTYNDDFKALLKDYYLIF